MITFDGKSASFVPGKEVPNKEPPVSKFVVEKLYKVHRERLRDMQPVVDCHVEIPDFLTNTSWKKITEEHRREVIRMHNETIYQRIAKVENSESAITTANRKHIKHVENELKLMKNLKEKGRVRNILKIQRENEDLLKRIERARPEYTRKAIKDWYRHHELFKKGRRSDPTAGHLGFKSLKGLFPAAIPRNPPSNIDLALDAASLRESNAGSPSGRASAPYSRRTPKQRSATAASGHNMVSSNEASAFGEAFPYNKPHTSPHKGRVVDVLGLHGHESRPNSASSAGRKGSHSANNAHEKNSLQSSNQNDSVSGSPQEEGDGDVYDDDQDGFHVLLSRPFAVPFESKNCIVHILACSRSYDENLYFRVVSNTSPPVFFSERPLSIDAAHEIVYSSSTNSILYSATNDDLMSLRGLLVDMFKEADDDGNGYLTFDEFEKLMSKVELGISSAELRYVIQEADDNDNGVVDYDEFVPLAVDMIQSFRARNRAKIFCSQRDSMIEEEVVSKMRSLDFEEMTQICIDKIHEYDTKKFGVLRHTDLKRALIAVSFAVGLTEMEIHMICNKLPLDQFGRCLYNSIGEILQKVRFFNLKLVIAEGQGSALHQYLLEACKQEERFLKRDLPIDEQSLTGDLPTVNFIKVLSSSPKITLSRLQILVIMAESGSTDGVCSYQSFLPIVSKTIEYMFEPKALRQRAELIDNSEITSESLMKSIYASGGVSFEKRLRALYNSCNVDASDGLDEDEFVRCLESLELELTGSEIRAYYTLMLTDHSHGVTFEDFKNFFVKNIVDMERVKHTRILQSRLHQNHDDDSPQTLAEINEQKKELSAHLSCLLEYLDLGNTGYVEHHELEELIRGLELNLSQFQIDMLFSEVETDSHGMVAYHAFLPVCTDLLQTFIARQFASAEDHKHEKIAESRAERIVKGQAHEIQHIAKKLFRQIKVIDNTVHDKAEKLSSVQNVLRNSHSGLTRTEANDLTHRLLDTQMHIHDTNDGKVELDQTDEALSPTDQAGVPVGKLQFDEHGQVIVETTHSSGLKPDAKLTINKNSRGRAISMVVKNSAMSSPGSDDTKKKHRFSLVDSKSTDGLKSPGHRKAIRILKDIDEASFEAMIFDVRKRSVMRGMLHNMNKNAVQQYIHHNMEHARKNLVTNGLLDSQTIYVPVKMAYDILEKAPALRLSRSQVIAVVASCEAFDKTGLTVDYKRFSQNAAAIIDKLFDTHHQLNRANVLDISLSTVDDAQIMNGLSLEDCNFYLETAFNEITDSQGLVDHLDFLNIVRNIPLLKLTEKDAVTVYAAAEHHPKLDKVAWRDSLGWMYDTLHILLKERFIQRRMVLLTASVPQSEDPNEKDDGHYVLSVAEQEALSTLTSLAEKLVDFVKVRMENNIVKVLLPTDKESYGTEVVEEKSPEEVCESLEGHSCLLVDIPMFKIPVLSKGRRRGADGNLLPRAELIPGLASLSSDAESSFTPSSAQPAIQRRNVSQTSRIPSELMGHLKIAAVEREQSVDRELVITFVGDGTGPATMPSFSCTLLPNDRMRLPSRCVVDRETALEFASALASRLSVDIVNPMSATHTLVMNKL